MILSAQILSSGDVFISPNTDIAFENFIKCTSLNDYASGHIYILCYVHLCNRKQNVVSNRPIISEVASTGRSKKYRILIGYTLLVT